MPRSGDWYPRPNISISGGSRGMQRSHFRLGGLIDSNIVVDGEHLMSTSNPPHSVMALVRTGQLIVLASDGLCGGPPGVVG